MFGGALALVQISHWRLAVAKVLADRGETDVAHTLLGRDVPYAVAIVAATFVTMPVPSLLGATPALAG